jgi:hypothetical protein
MLDDIERGKIKAKLDVIGPFRDFLIKAHAPHAMLTALDDWTEELSGDRSFFWSRHVNCPTPRILLKHERRTHAKSLRK